MPESLLNHVALVVEKIETEVAALDVAVALHGAIEHFPREGTRELYVGDDSLSGRLLLIQPVSAGPYQRALQLRGAGLHHLAIDVPDLDRFLHAIPDDGWQLHPHSFETLSRMRVAWLKRSGHPLIEVQEASCPPPTGGFIERVEFPFADYRLLEQLNCPSLYRGKGVRLLTANDTPLSLPSLNG